MLYSIKDREDLQILDESVSLGNQVKAVRLQNKLGKQNFYEDLKKVFETITKSIKDISEEVTKTMTETSVKNNKTIANLIDKFLEIMNNGGILASYLMSPLSRSVYLENSIQFKLVKDSSSNRVNGLLIHNTIPITFYYNLLTICDTGKEFELEGDCLKMITNKNYNVDLSNLADKKLMYDFAKEMNFDVKATCNKSTRDRTLIKLLKSPGLMISASGISKTMFLSSDPNELFDRLRLLLQGKEG